MIHTTLQFLEKNSLILAFLIVGIITYLSEKISKHFTKNKLPGSAIAIIIGLILAYFGGVYSGGEKGISDIKIFSGFGTLGGAMFRDLAIISTSFGASFMIMKKTGLIGILSLILGIIFSFFIGSIIAYLWGYQDAESVTTIAAGACTYIVGPVTGYAIGANPEVITLSLAAGVVKAIAVAIATPLVAKYIGLDNPKSAMVFGGMLGTNTGVMAGLAATDPKLVPYGALTATFYTGLGCLVCPSILYFLVKLILG
jgi:malonate transporter MadM subunit